MDKSEVRLTAYLRDKELVALDRKQRYANFKDFLIEDQPSDPNKTGLNAYSREDLDHLRQAEVYRIADNLLALVERRRAMGQHTAESELLMARIGEEHTKLLYTENCGGLQAALIPKAVGYHAKAQERQADEDDKELLAFDLTTMWSNGDPRRHNEIIDDPLIVRKFSCLSRPQRLEVAKTIAREHFPEKLRGVKQTSKPRKGRRLG